MRPRALLVALVAAASLLLAGPAAAATYVVTATTDASTGGCDLSSCTLREAISAANATIDADTVSIPAGTYALTLAGTGEDLNADGDLDVAASAAAGDLTIEGAGSTATIIDASATGERALHVGDVAHFVLRNLQVRGGAAGGAQHGGGILLAAASGSSLIFRVRFTDNTAGGDGGALYIDGGATVVREVRLDKNSAGGNGGAVATASSAATSIDRSELSSNTTTGSPSHGGALFAGAGTTTYISESTMYANGAAVDGGAIAVEGVSGVDVGRSTFWNNVADRNRTDGLTGHGGAFQLLGAGDIQVGSTIFDSNSREAAGDVLVPETCYRPAWVVGATLTPLTRNLISSTANCTGWNPGDLTNVSARLDIMSDSRIGGTPSTTEVAALRTESPAIDAAEPAACTGVTVDQLGGARMIGSSCDIGAQEAGSIVDMAVRATPANAQVVGIRGVKRYSIRLLNTYLAPGIARRARLRVNIPNGYTIAERTSPGMACTGTRVLMCTALASKDLLPQRTLTVKLGLRPSVLGTRKVTFITSALGVDQQAANNTETETMVSTNRAPRVLLGQLGAPHYVFGFTRQLRLRPTCPAGVRTGACSAVMTFTAALPGNRRLRFVCRAASVPAGGTRVQQCVVPLAEYTKVRDTKRTVSVLIVGSNGVKTIRVGRRMTINFRGVARRR